jgi:hypothetical protein
VSQAPAGKTYDLIPVVSCVRAFAVGFVAYQLDSNSNHNLAIPGFYHPLSD